MIRAVARQLAAVRAAPAAEPLRLRVCQSVMGCWPDMCRPASHGSAVHVDA